MQPTQENPTELSNFVKLCIQRSELSSSESTMAIPFDSLYMQEVLVFSNRVCNLKIQLDDELELMIIRINCAIKIAATRKVPPLKLQIKSFEINQSFFRLLIEEKDCMDLKIITVHEIWEIIDSFVYQYQLFWKYRENLENKTEKEMKTLKRIEQCWSFSYVSGTLLKLVEIAKSAFNHEKLPSRLSYMKFGYFAIFGLQQIYIAQADYLNAIKILDERHFFPPTENPAIFSNFFNCQVSAAYHTGFAYMMVGRYHDAINIIFATCVKFEKTLDMYKVNGLLPKMKTLKLSQKMKNILYISTVLNSNDTEPYFLDNRRILNPMSYLNSRKGDQKVAILKKSMQMKNYLKFKSCFLEGCPQFILKESPNLEGPLQDYSKMATENELESFIQQVKNHIASQA